VRDERGVYASKAGENGTPGAHINLPGEKRESEKEGDYTEEKHSHNKESTEETTAPSGGGPYPLLERNKKKDRSV